MHHPKPVKEVIFSDFFDTLVSRNCSAKQVFKNWAEKLEKQTDINSHKIYKAYNSINFWLCTKKIFKEHVLEEHIQTVFSKVYEQLAHKNQLCNKDEFMSNALEIYYQEELNSFNLNKSYVRFLQNQKSLGKKLYLLSDFYCPSQIFHKWLKELNLENLFEELFVSCDYDKEKATGTLYDYVLNKLEISGEKCIMIGDNYWSDIIMAESKNIKAQNIKNLNKKTIINDEWDEIFFKYDKRFTLSNHAFPLFLFTKRLYDDVISNGYKDVIFMSREGQFLKTLFDWYCSQIKDNKITTHYFYGSRNSVMAASLEPLEKEDFNLIFRFFICMSVKAFLHSIGFTPAQIQEVKENFSKNINRIQLIFNKSSAFKALKKNPVFQKIYEENRTRQSKAFGAYMETFNIDYKKDGLVFVDIGYHGTMQDLINKFYKGNVNIKGYFIKTRVSKKEMKEKIGLLSDKANKKLEGDKINQYDAYNYEQILRADHGRCLGYDFDENKKVYPIIDKELDDAEVYENYVKEMQAQIFDKFKSITEKSFTEKDNLTDLCIIYYYYAIKYKSDLDFNWIVDMQDSSHDDFGIVGYFGRLFSKKLRNFLFKKQDQMFVLKNKGYIKQLQKKFQ